jgi:hypothetical protein
MFARSLLAGGHMYGRDYGQHHQIPADPDAFVVRTVVEAHGDGNCQPRRGRQQALPDVSSRNPRGG